MSQLEIENLDFKSPSDHHELFSAKSVDESKASVYFTPTDGHFSPLPMQLSPVHINYINDGSEAAGGFDEIRSGFYRSVPLRSAHRNPAGSQRNSFTLPCDYLDETDEGNFIIPDPVYADDGKCLSIEDFHDVHESSTNSINALEKSSNSSLRTRRRKKRYNEKRRSRHSVENETLLLQDMGEYDVSKGARPKIVRNSKQSVNGEHTQLIKHVNVKI